MKRIAETVRDVRTAAARGESFTAEGIYSVLGQTITLLRIATVVLSLYLKFKLRALIQSWRDGRALK